VITLRKFDSSGPAEVARAVLEANGIFCRLLDENAHLYLIGAVPIRLVVSEDHAAEAERILNEQNLPKDTQEANASE
jgi:Putative prokaryotic signal transducing protein